MRRSSDSEEEFQITNRAALRFYQSIETWLHSISSILRATTIVVVAGCTPTIYKPEIVKFSNDVASASASFDQLVAANVAQDFKDRNTELAASMNRLALSDSCLALQRHVSEQNQCLSSWSIHRQNPSSPEPTCNEPTSFAPLIPLELKDCELGTFKTTRSVGAQLLLRKTAKTIDA
jgi:hypothetical protein